MAKFVMSCIALTLFIAALAAVDARPSAHLMPPASVSDADM
jgi:hypothetical protein